MASMTEETRAFFALSDTQEWMRECKARHANLRFILFKNKGEPDSKYGIAFNDELFNCSQWAGLNRDLGYWGEMQGRPVWWADALREGRALVEEHMHDFANMAQVCSCGLTAKEWFTTSSVGTVAKPEPPRPVCACGAEIHPIRGARERCCGDCLSMSIKAPHAPLDSRIAAARVEVKREPHDWDARDAEYEL